MPNSEADTDSGSPSDSTPIELPLRRAGRPALSTFDDIAIAIRNFPQVLDPQQMHIGIYGRDDDDGACMLHQPWDNRPLLENNSIELDQYWWLPTAFAESDIVRKQFFDHCLNLVQKNPHGVPYGICYAEGDHFDAESNKFVRRDNAAGLTCATFVLELFRSYGFEIANRHTWIERSDDRVWADRTCESLKRISASPAIAERVRAQLEAFNLQPMRFRPEEVAAAGALFRGEPMPMQDAQAHGRVIVSEVCRSDASSSADEDPKDPSKLDAASTAKPVIPEAGAAESVSS